MLRGLTYERRGDIFTSLRSWKPGKDIVMKGKGGKSG